MCSGCRSTQEVSHISSLAYVKVKELKIIEMVAVSPRDRCKLFCRVMGSSAYYLLKEKVIDGTTCGPDTFDICVNGACLPAGCDRRLHSTKALGEVK